MYNPYQSVYQNAFQNQFTNQYPPLQRQEIVKVNGKQGAEMYNLSPNSSVLLLDESAPIVWLKTTDGAGFATLTPYTITPYKEKPMIDTESLEARVRRLEERLIYESDFRNAKCEANNAEEPITNQTDDVNGSRSRKSTRNDKENVTE